MSSILVERMIEATTDAVARTISREAGAIECQPPRRTTVTVEVTLGRNGAVLETYVWLGRQADISDLTVPQGSPPLPATVR